MKTKMLALIALVSSAAAFAAPLPAPTAVHTKPDEKSPAITVLKAGSEPVAASASAPTGWMAIELPGPHLAYVQQKDMMAKSLDVIPGASIYFAPKVDGGVLAIAERGDHTEIVGMTNSKWAKISLNKKLVGYIKAAPSTAVPTIANAPAVAPAPSTPAPLSPSPIAPVAYGTTTAGQPAPTVNLGDSASSTLPRSFQGRFVSTRRPLAPRRPYDWALNDDSGKRYAFLDISKLLQTEQIEKFADHTVVVYGTATATPDGKDILIQVQSLQLK